MPDGYLAAFNLGLAVSFLAVFFGVLVRKVDWAFNLFNGSKDDLWR